MPSHTRDCSISFLLGGSEVWMLMEEEERDWKSEVFGVMLAGAISELGLE